MHFISVTDTTRLARDDVSPENRQKRSCLVSQAAPLRKCCWFYSQQMFVTVSRLTIKGENQNTATVFSFYVTQQSQS